jgi:glycosyltransferase involved in cell wall biosynthesis
MKFSIIIPARNEGCFLGRCLESIRVAAEPYPGEVETIVVLNRCTDNTEAIALDAGARTIREDARNLAKIRNAGAHAATGQILVTIDADSGMTRGTLSAIDRALSSGRTVGGGTLILPDRLSLGLVVTFLWALPFLILNPISGGLFWCYRQDFEAVGGFNESLASAEDTDFALRLKVFGKSEGRPFSTLRGGHIITSCRKFDQFGHWFVWRHPRRAWRLFVDGHSQRDADEFFYDVER